ncbi:MAG: M13 family metallopeptidase [bacterium]|nr:M13 family metallopeptidase [bacterium]
MEDNHMQSQRFIDPENFDLTVRPTDDFFTFVNGGWFKKNPIPQDESRWGSFVTLNFQVEQQLKEILDDLVRKESILPGSNAQKIRDFYLNAMDTEKLDRLGYEPLAGIRAVVDGVKSPGDAVRVIGHLHRAGINVFWAPSVHQDKKQSEIMSLHLYQGGLGLPDRDYYTDSDGASAAIRDKYLAYIAALLKRFGFDSETAANRSRLILNLETRLAEASMTSTELRDVEKQYNKTTSSELVARTPKINWQEYFAEIKAPEMESLILAQPKFLEEVNRIFDTVPIEDIKTYLEWHVLNGMADYLSEGFEEESFNFYGRTFGGATEMKPRWRRVLAVMNGMLDQALGQLYVERHFSEEAKRKINDLVGRIIAAYRARIERLDWMGPETKGKALEKLVAVSRKLGYPDVWKDFTALEIGTDSYAGNFMRAYEFEFARLIKKIGKPVDRTEWHMPPQMVNAYYSPTMNEIVFPAAILQPPFFDHRADDAINFGGIGGVIGHELTHGFDDKGALFDSSGNLKNWWTAEDKERFEEKTKHLIEQFDRYEPLPGVHIKGSLTVGENLADLGGILIAYDGLDLFLREGRQSETIDGFTLRQRFFLSWAIVWRLHMREELLRMRLQTDPHSPPYYRVNGPLSNLPEFYKAFSCEPGDRLWRAPEDRVKVW